MRVLSLFDGISCGRVALERAGIPVTQYAASEVDKYAISVTQKNYPGTVQLGDVRFVRQLCQLGLIKDIDMLIGGSPCFIAGTKVMTLEGMKNIEDVCTTDSVLSHHRVFNKVLKTGGTMAETWRITAQGIPEIVTTEEHPFYVRQRSWVWDNSRRSNVRVFSKPEWVSAGKLTKNHFLAIPKINTSENSMNLTDEECFIIGRYIADGHTRKDFRISENRPNHRYWQLILSVGSHKIPKTSIRHSIYQHTESVHRMVFSNKRLVQIVEEHCGCGAANKYISTKLLNLPKEKLKILVEGILSGDGYRDSKGCWNLTSISKELIHTLTLAVAKVYGTASSIYFNKTKDKAVIQGRTINQSDSWSISFYEETRKGSNCFVDGEFVWQPVKTVEKTGGRERVYNLEVAESNSYTANLAVVHNCTDLSFAGKQGGIGAPTLEEYKRLVSEGFEFKGQSFLFWEYVWIREILKPKYFLLENVKMKKEWFEIFNEIMGVEGYFINSALVSAQNRQRYYWFNWDVGQPEDKGILLRDVIEDGLVDRGKSYCIDANYYKGGSVKNYMEKSRRQIVFGEKPNFTQSELRLMVKQISPDKPQRPHTQNITGGRIVGRKLNPETGKRDDYNPNIKTNQRLELREDGKAGCITTVQKDSVAALDNITYRKLTPIECERLQTLPDNYTEGVSNTQRYKALGNAWTVDVVAHILRGLPL